jgi:hypothetical protein
MLVIIFFRGVWNGWVLIPAQILLFVIKMKTGIVGKAVKLVKKQEIRFSFPVLNVANLLVSYVTQIQLLVLKELKEREVIQVLKERLDPQVQVELMEQKVLRELQVR